MPRQDLTIRTADGDCPSFLFTPAGEGPWPAAIIYMDALAIRPTLFAMAQRLADAGHVVLLPDMFYRLGGYAEIIPSELGPNDFREKIVPMMASIDNTRAASDTAAFLNHLASRPDVAGTRLGVTGYCMGGGMALTVAGVYPDRIAAAASFHGGNLATDKPDSPHLLAPQMQAEVYFAGADQDGSYPPEMAERLDRALTDAGVQHRCEIYPGAKHGWTMSDLGIYDEAAAERAWRELTSLFARTLR